jgi:predicted nucleotidyltransferase component of viral defense system
MNYTLFISLFREKYAGTKDKTLLFNYLREELQYLILSVIYTQTAYPVYFMGGTQLRLSYKINRFSEDLDFALDKPDPFFPSEKFFNKIINAFSEKISGFKMSGGINAKKNVVKITLSFSRVLYDLGLSFLADATLKIKIEIDINPPGKAAYGTQYYHSLFGDYAVNTYDPATAFAGKAAVILFRKYRKGRDYYDFQWYLQQKPPVILNLNYFNARSAQLNQPEFKNIDDLVKALIKKISQADMKELEKDLQRFVFMNTASFEKWLKDYKKNTTALLKNYISNHES